MIVLSLLACSAWELLVPDQTEPHSGDSPTFDLEGAHQQASCDGCHGPGEPDVEVPTTCDGCHAEDAPEDDHPEDPQCEACHDPVGWEVIGELG